MKVKETVFFLMLLSLSFWFIIAYNERDSDEAKQEK